jgi:hypothetical protein
MRSPRRANVSAGKSRNRLKFRSTESGIGINRPPMPYYSLIRSGPLRLALQNCDGKHTLNGQKKLTLGLLSFTVYPVGAI